MPTSVLTIAGSAVDFAATDCVLSELEIDIDRGADTLQFAQRGVALPPTWHGGQAVELEVDGTLVFSGVIVSEAPRFDERLGYVRSYKAESLAYLANLIPVTSPYDSTNVIRYNLPADDPDYVPSLAGQTVGQILAAVVTAHLIYASPALGLDSLTDLGIGDLYTPVGGDPAYLVDPAALTIVPTHPVCLQGERLWDALCDFLQDWYGVYRLRVEPDGSMRIYDTTAFTARTLTLGVDPVDPPALARDTANSSTRVAYRGMTYVEPVLLQLSKSDLTEGFSSGDKTAWKLADFTNPSGGRDSGTCTVPSSTTVTVDPTDNTRTWVSNFWGPSNRQGWITLRHPIATGIDQLVTRQIISNTSLSAGGTSTLTLDRALPNTGFTTYEIVGKAGGTSETWRRYDVANSYIGQHMTTHFPVPVPWTSGNGLAAGLVSYPVCSVLWSSSGSSPYTEWQVGFQVDPNDSSILLNEPSCRPFGTQSDLETGGFTSHTSTNGVISDMRVLLAVNKGTNLAVYPADSGGAPVYSGTAYSVEGIERTLWVDDRAWVDPGQQANANAIAEQIWKTVSAAVVEGTLVYSGFDADYLAFGVAINIDGYESGSSFATDWEALALPVRSVVLEWLTDPRGPQVCMHLKLSNRRKPFTGADHWLGQPFTYQPFLGDYSGDNFSAGAFDATGGVPGSGADANAGLNAFGDSFGPIDRNPGPPPGSEFDANAGMNTFADSALLRGPFLDQS